MKLTSSASSLAKLPLLLAGIVAAVAMTGCTAASDAEQGDDDRAARVAGDLVLDINEADHVAGRFTRDATTLAFEFTRTAHGSEAPSSRTAILRSGDGRDLVTSVLVGGTETTRIYGGRLVVTGAPNTETPAYEGDQAELAAVQGEPSMLLLSDVRVALEAKGVARDLQMSDRGSPSGGLAPQKYFSGWDGYWHLGPGERQTFGTWSFWYPTYVNLRNFSGRCATAVLWHTGPESVIVPAYGFTSRARYYWGFPVTVENLNAYVNWESPWGVCAPGQIGAITY